MAKEYIERQRAIVDACNSLELYPSEYAELGNALNRIPAADVVEVRHGRWRWVAYDANPKIGNWHCTYCNRIPKSFQKEDFCPNCGAKMDVEEV